MSKIIESLKKADEVKNGKKGGHENQSNLPKEASGQTTDTVISSALNKEIRAPQQLPNLPNLSRPASIPQTTIPTDTREKPSLTIIIASVGLLLLLITNFALIVTFKNNAKNSANTTEKLSRIEGLLNKVSTRIKEQDNDISKAGRQIEANQEDISQLEKKISNQATSVNNLNNAKKTLYKKVEELYTQVDALKAGRVNEPTNQ